MLEAHVHAYMHTEVPSPQSLPELLVIPEKVQVLQQQWEHDVDVLVLGTGAADDDEKTPPKTVFNIQQSAAGQSNDPEIDGSGGWEFLREPERDEAAAADARLQRDSVAREKILSAFSASFTKSERSSAPTESSLRTRRTSSGNQVSVQNDDILKRILCNDGSSEDVRWSIAQSPTLSFRDRLVGLVSRETDVERLTRVRLKAYKQALQLEVQSTKAALHHHVNRREELDTDFQGHEKQLQKWGLTSLLPSLRLQALFRTSRAQLLAEMAAHALRMLQLRTDETLLLSQDPDQQIDDGFFLTPEVLLTNDITLNTMRTRLRYLDKCCQEASKRFKRLLPELESKTFEQRQKSIIKVVRTYNDIVGDVWNPGTFEEYLQWQENRDKKTRFWESQFAAFICDEREREGRLFRRWAALADIVSHREQPDGPSKPRPRAPYIPDHAMSPRSIHAFSTYFARNVLVAQYSIPDELHQAVVTLTLSTVFRRLHPYVFVYKPAALRKQDIRWRHKCRCLSRIPQNDYGVPAEFLVETIPQEAPADDEQSECNATALHPTPTSGTQVRGINSAYVARFVSIQQQLPRIPFAQSCVVLGRVCCCVTPDEIVHCILMAMKWLHLDACQLTGNDQFLGADVMFPLLVLVMVNSNIPCIHLVLLYLRSFGTIDGAGEAAYYVTCMEAAVAFIMRFSVPDRIEKECFKEEEDECAANSADGTCSPNFRLSTDGEFEPHGNMGDTVDTDAAMRSLGQWLREQQTMEDTISVLQQEGWMI